MNLDQLTSFVWNRNVLHSVLVELTYRCNLDCSFCYNDINAVGEPLSFEQYLQLLKDLEMMEAMHVTLSGGEPLAHPDFFRIGTAARELGFVVRIKSNGHALNERMVRRIQQEIDPFGLDISLHGASAATHDRQTRVPGSFDKLVKNLETLKQLGMRFQLNTPVTVWNESELDEMCQMADQLEVDILIDGDITPRDDGDRGPLELAPSSATQLKILEIKTQRAQRRIAGKEKREGGLQAATTEPRLSSAPSPPPVSVKGDLSPDEGGDHLQKKQCGAGSSTVTIDPYGAVYPCTQWRQPVGNLHEQSIMQIWTESQALHNIRAQLVDLKKLNTARGIGNNIGFCAARAHQETGSTHQIYPLASLRVELQEKLRK